jgi:hypothetical protein
MTDAKLYLFAYLSEGMSLSFTQNKIVKAHSITESINKFVKACGTGKLENDVISSCLRQCTTNNFRDKQKAARATDLYKKMMDINDGEVFDSHDVYFDPDGYIKFVNDNFEQICEFVEDSCGGQDDSTIFYVTEVKDIIE